jgi:predicted enzyme related to lactoylglutathione lyase
MKVVEFAFVANPATDAGLSRDFYEGILGLTASNSTINGHEFWIEYEVGPHTLGIGNEPFMKPSPHGAQLVLEVDNFDETVAHLRKHRVAFAVEPFDMPRCRAAVIVDPDGNRIGIHKRTNA